jgi:hypothetical protein
VKKRLSVRQTALFCLDTRTALPLSDWVLFDADAASSLQAHIPQFEKRLFGYELLLFLLVLPDYCKA